MIFTKVRSLNGVVQVPGDKSISHRGVMFGAIAKGTTEIYNFLQGADCLSTIACFEKMGISIENKGNMVLVHGKGLRGLTPPSEPLDVGNSGTTTRLISGILSGQDFSVILNGDESIQTRPMKRIMIPLNEMGAHMESLRGNDCAPLRIGGGALKGIDYISPVASAQVKSAILLAGLYADGPTSVTEPYLSRNHTELMLESFGARIETKGTTATIWPTKELYGQRVTVPGDISSAAYFIAAGLITPDSCITIRQVGINPTRDGILEVCQAMGGNISLSGRRKEGGEPVADITVRTSRLTGTVIEGSLIPRLIDELPVIALLACYAEGATIIRDAQELKVKESNRIDVMVQNLKAMGADVTGTEDGMIIHGGKPLHGAVIDTRKDHRIAMTFAIAGLNAEGETVLTDSDCVAISYPTFYENLCELSE